MPRNTSSKFEDYLEKPLPSNTEAEAVILGSILLDNSHLAQAVEILKPEDFYSPFHRHVFEAMIGLFQRGEKVDPLLIAEEMKKRVELDKIGGISAIVNLTYGLHHLPNISHYAEIVRDKALLRKLISSCRQILSDALSEEGNAEEILDRAEQSIFALSQERSYQNFVPIRAVAEQVMLKLQEYAKRETHALTGLATGFIKLDQLTSGLQKGDLIIVAARPAMGKTAFALTIAQNTALKEDAVVAIFSLEMSKEQLAMRMLCSEAKINAHRFRTGFLSREEWIRLSKAIGLLSDAKIFIDDTPAISILEMRAKARRLKSEKKRLDLIIVDYLQMIRTTQRHESRQQEVSQISRDLKSLAKELDVPVLAISQLSRAPESRHPPRPQMSDLRDSGSIEQDADVVIFIYREEYYKKTEENEGLAEVIVAKQRNGPTDTVRMVFLKEFTRFENFYEEE